MPPFVGLPHLGPRDFNSSVAPEQFSNQWTNPSAVFTVLLILGGDVIGRALAQLAGTRMPFLPFSFGWVAYSVSTVVSAVGENRLMPVTDCPCKVISSESGYVRDNASWIIGRMVRDFDYWMERGPSRNPDGHKIRQRMEEAGLCVSIYEAGAATKNPRLRGPLDWIGLITAAAQLGIAAVPWAQHGDWSVFLVTAVGSLLALATVQLPQWAEEKWPCREKTNKTTILTKGNGSQHAIVILGHNEGLDLADLASNSLGVTNPLSGLTRASTCVLAVAWIMLLVAAAGIHEHTWFLLAVGGLGMAENVFEASKRREPESYGIPLMFMDVIAQDTVMETLYEVEEKYPRVGSSMLQLFFPGELGDDDTKKWDDYKERYNARPVCFYTDL